MEILALKDKHVLPTPEVLNSVLHDSYPAFEEWDNVLSGLTIFKSVACLLYTKIISGTVFIACSCASAKITLFIILLIFVSIILLDNSRTAKAYLSHSIN